MREHNAPSSSNNRGQAERRQGLLESYSMTDPVDLNAAADSRTDAFANPPPRPRIEYEVILLYTGVVLSVVGLAALSGWVFGIMTLVLPVPGFERMAPASAVG